MHAATYFRDFFERYHQAKAIVRADAAEKEERGGYLAGLGNGGAETEVTPMFRPR